MYTVIPHMRNINIDSSSLPLDITSTEKRSYQYNMFFYFVVTNTSTIYTDVAHYICPISLMSLLGAWSPRKDLQRKFTLP